MRLLFAGSADFAVPALRRLAGEHEIVAVNSAPDRPAGRGLRLTPNPLAAEARRLGLRLLQPVNMNEPAVGEGLRTLEPDVGVLVAYGQILRREVLGVPRLGWINLHASLAPRWRGASPVAAAILAGDERTGVSVLAMGEGLDDGPVYASETEAISPRDTSAELSRRLAERGAVLLSSVLRDLEQGRAQPQAQDGEGATYAPKLSRKDAGWDWSGSAEELDRRVRALNPWPGVRASLGGREVKLLAGRAVEGAPPEGARPGEVLAGLRGDLRVVGGQGIYEVDLLQEAGRKPMDGPTYLRTRAM